MRKSLNFFGGVAAATMMASAAYADCGEVSLTEMNWPSSQIITHVSKFLMEQGYGCTVELVPSATVTSVASLAENNEPDIVTELWLNSAGQAYLKLEEEGRVSRLTEVFNPGGVEGWWIPTYLAEKHPELKTVQDVLANPDLVGGRFNNCPVGWGCRIANDNIINALGLRDKMEVFDHGSGETLAGSIAAALQIEVDTLGEKGKPRWRAVNSIGANFLRRHNLGLNQNVIARQETGTPNPEAQKFIDQSITYDLFYAWNHAWNGTVSLGALNVLNTPFPRDNSNPTRTIDGAKRVDTLFSVDDGIRYMVGLEQTF